MGPEHTMPTGVWIVGVNLQWGIIDSSKDQNVSLNKKKRNKGRKDKCMLKFN